jgi:hypothetical protein
MEDGFTQVLLQGGMGSIIVVAWFFFNKANMAAFTAILAAQTARDDKNIDLLTKLIEAQDKRAEVQQDTLQLICGQMSEVKSDVKLMANTKCPLQGNWHSKESE